jgi:hypothetical protein
MFLSIDKSSYKLTIRYKVLLFSVFGHKFFNTKEIVLSDKTTRGSIVKDLVDTIVNHALDDHKDMMQAEQIDLILINKSEVSSTERADDRAYGVEQYLKPKEKK